MEKIIIIGILSIITILTGFVLHNLGRPLNTLIFTIHKLSALVAVILIGMLIYNFLKSTGANPLILFLTIFVVLSIIALFVSGALLSIDKFANITPTLLIIHNVAIVFAAISTIITIYFLLKLK